MVSEIFEFAKLFLETKIYESIFYVYNRYRTVEKTKETFAWLCSNSIRANAMLDDQTVI